MADNKIFKTDRQKIEELTEKLEVGMGELRSSMEKMRQTVEDFIEGMEDAMRSLKKEWELERYEAAERQKEDEPEKIYQEVEVFGIPALFDNTRIRQEDVPAGLHCYDLRGSDDDPGEPVTVEHHAVVNHAASILTAVPLPIPEQGFLRLGEELNFTGGMMDAREFMEGHSGMDLDLLMENMEDAICHENEGLFLNPSSEYGRYAIYQLNEDAVKDNYLFMNMEYVKNKGIEVRGEDYSLVYGGRLPEDVTLERLFEKFNVSRPENFSGHSLSVSDVVVTNRGGEVKAYYVDSFGYADLPEFVEQRLELPEPVAEEQPQIYPAVYTHSAEYAAEHWEGELRMISHNLNIACKKAIEAAVNENFDGLRLNPDAVKPVLEEYGAERVAYVLSATLQRKMWDGRFSKGNKEWASQTYIPEDMVMGRDIGRELEVSSHPAVLDGFVDSFREELRRREKAAGLEPEQIKTKQPEPQLSERQPESLEEKQIAAVPGLEDEDEIIALGDEREQVLAEMKQYLGKRETELAFQIADRYIGIQESDGGYDYSIMGTDYKEIDGGVYDNPDASIREVLDNIVEDLKNNPPDNGARGSIRDSDELILVDYAGLMERAEAADKIEPRGSVVADFKAKTEELFHSISDMNPSEIEETVKCHVQAKIDESGMNAVIEGVAVTGSRCRGLEKSSSDLDVVVELATDAREDDLFFLFNEDGLHIGEVAVDINPITAQKTGTLETYLPQVEEYLEDVRIARENEPVSLFNIHMHGGERWYQNTSGLDVKGLCRAYAECEYPMADMEKYGERMEAADYGRIEDGERLDFSVEFNGETNKITVFDGKDFVCRGMREMLFLQKMEDEPDAATEIAVKIDCLSHDCDIVSYHENVKSMEENVSEIVGAIRQGEAAQFMAWLTDIIFHGAVSEEMERAVEILEKLNDYKPLAKIEELEEQNYNMIDNMPNNGAGEKAQKEESKKMQEKPAGRVSLKERLAQKQAIVSGKGNEPQESKGKNHREI